MLMQKNEYEDMYRAEDTFWWYRGLREITSYFIMKYLGAGDKLLDAGCGTGKNVETMIAQGLSVTGIDLSEDAIQFCKKRGLENVSVGNITSLEFGDQTFDGAICMDVLGLVESDSLLEKSIQEFNRVLKPGAILIINCAAFEWLRSQHDDVCNLRRRFTNPELNELLTKCGFTIERSSYRVFLLFLPVAIVKLIKRLFQRRDSLPTTDQSIPAKPINALLTLIMSVESSLIKSLKLPFGSSVFIVARKNS